MRRETESFCLVKVDTLQNKLFPHRVASLAGTIHYFSSLAAAAWHINLGLLHSARSKSDRDGGVTTVAGGDIGERGIPFRGRSNQHDHDELMAEASGDTFGTPVH